MMLQTEYQDTRPYGFRQQDFFFKFILYNIVSEYKKIFSCFSPYKPL